MEATKKKIEFEKLTVQDAFSRHFYIVPDYQRDYIWSEKQVKQLLDDINEHKMDAGDSEYFIGITLVSNAKGKGDKHFEIIDGQQRLTTIFLILCALRSLFNKVSDETSEDRDHLISKLIEDKYIVSEGNYGQDFKLNPQYENTSIVIQKIIETVGDPDAVKEAIIESEISIYGAVEKIFDAYTMIYKYFQYDDIKILDSYLGHLSNKVIFAQINTGINQALKMFETVNERGIGLSPMDLLKNLLFRTVKHDDFEELKSEWKEIIEILEENKEKPMRFLKYFILANHGVRTKSESEDNRIKEEQIYNWFLEKENIKLTNYKKNPFGFVHQISKNAKLYTDFSKGYGNDGRENYIIESIKKLTGGSFKQHYILLLAAAPLQKPLFDQFLKQLEVFLFYYIFTKTSPNIIERKFASWALELKKISQMKNEDQKKQRTELNAFIQKTFGKDIETKKIELNDALKRMTLKSMQKSRIKYLLARLTEHVQMEFTGVKFRGSLSQYIDHQLEHILPEKPELELLNEWKNENENIDYDDAKNFLGNLTILEKPINIVAGNSPYKFKKLEYARSNFYLTKSLNKIETVGQNTSINRINKKLKSFEKWDSMKDIEERQEMLIALVHDVWKITEITA